MDEAVALVVRTLDVELAGVAEMPVGSEEVILRAGVGWREGVVGSLIERGGRDSQVGYTLLHREPVIAEDQAADPRFRPSAIAQAHGVVSALSVMIASPDEPFGVLGALSTSRRTFSRSDVSFVQAVANVLAGAVERSRAQERLSEVREAERGRIARDLHDDALQELTDALVQADRGRSAGLGPEAAGQLVSTLKRVGQQLRGAIFDLRLRDEVSCPFPETLGALVDVHRAMAVGCEIGLDVSWEPPAGLVGDRAIEILRIVGEALTNAWRHSGARHVRVSARGSEDRICVEVTDDGRGFDPEAGPSGTDGLGIKGMRERTALLGGDLDLRSALGRGTTIHFEFVPPQHDEPPTASARILLVEDHAAVRQAIAGMFQQQVDLDVVGQAASLAEARGMLRDVDVAVVDLGLPDGFGGDLIKELHEVNPGARRSSSPPASIPRRSRAQPTAVPRSLSTSPPTSTSSWTPYGGCTAAPPRRPSRGRRPHAPPRCQAARLASARARPTASPPGASGARPHRLPGCAGARAASRHRGELPELARGPTGGRVLGQHEPDRLRGLVGQRHPRRRALRLLRPLLDVAVEPLRRVAGRRRGPVHGAVEREDGASCPRGRQPIRSRDALRRRSDRPPPAAELGAAHAQGVGSHVAVLVLVRGQHDRALPRRPPDAAPEGLPAGRRAVHDGSVTVTKAGMPDSNTSGALPPRFTPPCSCRLLDPLRATPQVIAKDLLRARP